MSPILFTLLSCCMVTRLRAQSSEAQILLLDVDKLSAFRKTLEDMKTGYTQLRESYEAVRGICEGSYQLHEAFLDALWVASPAVRRDWKVAGILAMQKDLASEYQAAFRRLGAGGGLHPEELVYLRGVARRVIAASTESLDDLATLLTDGQMQMTDAERLEGIDRIYEKTEARLAFLRRLFSGALLLDHARNKALEDTHTLQTLTP